MLVLIALSIVGRCACGDARAQSGADVSAQPQIKSVVLGFDGVYKVGYWTPVHVTIGGGAKPGQARLELIVPDGDGVQSAVIDEQPWDLPINQETTLTRYVKFGRIGSEITARLRDADGNLLASSESPAGRLPPAEPSTRELVLTVGRDAGVDGTLRDANRGRTAEEGRISKLVQDAARLPEVWFGYEGVDALVLTTADGKTHRDLTDKQIEAIDLWVKMGGHLILSAGREGEALFGAGGRFGRFAPGTFVEVVEESRTDDLEEYARSEQIEAAEGERRLRLPMSLLTDTSGHIDAHESIGHHVPVVIRAPYGFGQIVFLAVDLDSPPISTWSGRPRLVARLLDPSLRRPDESEAQRSTGQLSHVGYRDMTGQLRGALDQFQGVTPFAFSWIAALIVIYILLIGPIDYFVLRKLVGNMAWTWATFPVMVVGCCALAYYLAGSSRGDSVKLNQVDLVDIDVESALVRGTSWSHVYSPSTERFDLSLLPPRALSGDSGGALLSWQGLPGDAMGGMNSENTARLFNQPYRIASPALPDSGEKPSLIGMPIQIGSSKTLTARWWSEFHGQRLDKLMMDRNGLLLIGSFGNPLPVELRECILYHAGSAYVMERGLAPGQTVNMRELPSPRTLEWHLTRRRMDPSEERTVERVTSWNRTDDNVPRILELMMFYDAAGGGTYTGLLHQYQDDLDLSTLLRFDRATLVGRAERPAVEIARDGKPLTKGYDRQWTWYRIVFPVGKEESRGVGE